MKVVAVFFRKLTINISRPITGQLINNLFLKMSAFSNYSESTSCKLLNSWFKLWLLNSLSLACIENYNQIMLNVTFFGDSWV